MRTFSCVRSSYSGFGNYWKPTRTPDVWFEDARKYIPDISVRRRMDPAIGLAALDEVGHLVESDRSLYEEYEKVARERVARVKKNGEHNELACSTRDRVHQPGHTNADNDKKHE